MTNLNETNELNEETLAERDVPEELASQENLPEDEEKIENEKSSATEKPTSCESGKCNGNGNGDKGPGTLFFTLGAYVPSNMSSNLQKIYALGNLALDFGSEVKRDIIIQHMEPGRNPFDVKDMIAHLKKNPMDAGAISWTLTVNGNPIYAILPAGPYASEGYQILLKMLRSQEEEGAERISLPGIVTGSALLMSGMTVPVVCPDIRGIFSWTTKELVLVLCGKQPSEKEGSHLDDYNEKLFGVRNLLDKIYYDLENLGVSSQERAINYAATNAFNIEKIFERTAKNNFHLSSISTEKSAVCRPGSDCWDVKLTFFDPEHQTTRAKQTFRYTIDVSDVLPVKIGPIRSWNEY
ncbi:MAG: hypothetical protein MUF15_23615 [Acidobacteria bacterium]|jgi:cyanobactin maturation PatA/PatG family protease|nr:hypothetical protein [Acidobacteriota bacterium]